jgi:hypothetical protein
MSQATIIDLLFILTRGVLMADFAICQRINRNSHHYASFNITFGVVHQSYEYDVIRFDRNKAFGQHASHHGS